MTWDRFPIVAEVYTYGYLVNSRYGEARELIGLSQTFPCGMLATRQGINWSLGWMEMLQLIGGVYDLEALKRVAPKANHDLFTLQMAYGPRVADQIPRLLDVLRNNPDSRQAVVFIGGSADGMSSNLPCTLSMQFLLRNEVLHGVVSMRSWDLCRGLPYDIMMFSGLLAAVAQCLAVKPGNFTVSAGSAHIYISQWGKIPHWSPKTWRFEEGPDTWGSFVGWARNNIPLLEKGGTPGCIVVEESTGYAKREG